MCENSNVCHISLINGTVSGHAYCTCRGEWAGPRCEARIYISAQYVTTGTVTLEMRGVTSSGLEEAWKLKDLHISEMTVALWNLNISGQCLLLQKEHAENVIVLEGLARDQEYIVCVANGFADSCSSFRQRPLNATSLSNCIHFQTKLFDEAHFDVGLIVVPCAIVIFIIAICIFFYCNRHSLLVQLCLNKVCCRSCYRCRRHARRSQRTKRDTSGRGLMTPDLVADFESLSEAHSLAVTDPGRGRTHSSNASSSASRRSACSLEPDAAAPGLTSLDQSSFLYEDQSLVKPIYSPQDHKIMTLTYLDEDFSNVSSEYPDSNYLDSAYPADHQQNSTTEKRFLEDGIIDFHNVEQQLNIPWPFGQAESLSQLPCNGLPQEATSSSQFTGPVKQQYLHHPHLHRPYDKRHILQHQPRSYHTRLRSSQAEPAVKFRDTGQARLRQRPYSLPFKLSDNSPSEERALHSIPHNGYHPRHANRTSLMQSDMNMIPSVRFVSQKKDQGISSTFGVNSTRVNHLLSSPIRYRSILKEERPEVTYTPGRYGDNEAYMSNTLPRSKKQKFVSPFAVNNDISGPSLSLAADKWSLPVTPSRRPRWLDIPNGTTGLCLSNRSQLDLLEQSARTAAETAKEAAMPSEFRSHSKHVRSLISYFENNLSFLRLSKSNRATGEEEEFRDLQSPLAEERNKGSKKSRRSNGRRKKLPSTDSTRNSVASDAPIFEGHPSEHILPPFSNDSGDEVGDENTSTDVSDESSLASFMSQNGGSAISCYDDDDTNLVTPFVTEDSSDDDTYDNIGSLPGSSETLQDENVEAGQSLLNHKEKEDAQFPTE